MGLKAIPDDVVWALSAINLDQYELPEWNITVTKTGVNLSMIWKHHQPQQLNNTEPAGATSTSVIKKLGIPVSKLIGEPDKQAVDLQGYVQRMQPMQSILTIRPDQLRTGAESIGDQEPGQRVKANSIESPPKSESPQKYDDDYSGQENGHEQNMDEDKSGQVQRTSVITENRPIKHENGEKMDCGEGRHDHEGEESDEIDPGTDSQLQIDESEDVDVTEPDSKSIKLDSEQSYTDHTVKTGKIANWNLPSRKSPIQELLERHNLGHIGQSLAQAQQAQQQTTQSTAQSGQTQYSTLQSLYANPVFHQNLRTSVLQSRGITPQTLPLLLPQQGGVLNSQPKNLFLTTQHGNGLAAATGMSNLEALKAQTQRPMVSPVGRSPIPTHGMCGNLAANGTSTTTKNGKDKGPFSCSLCGRTFSLRGNLLRHERIHRGDKPFRCRFCNKAFIQRTDVLAHERVHTGEKPFACQFCGKRFPRRSTMKEHEKSFCRARVALEEGRKPILNGKDRTESESNSGEQSPASVSPPPTATQEAAAGLLAISGQIIASHQKVADHTMESSGSHDSSSSGSKTTSPEHTSSGSGSPSNSTGTTDHNVESKSDKKPLDATDFSVKAVIAN